MLYRSSTSRRQPRKGIVLLAVIIVLAVLGLAAFQYSELMTAEYRAAYSYSRSTQTRGFALSGIKYVAAILSDDEFYTTQLNSNPFDNATVFKDVLVQEGDTPEQTGYFSIIALVGPDDPNFGSKPYYFGVEDESAKLNINALLQYDKKGVVGGQMLQFLPNMTQDLSNSMLDWVDGTSSSPRSGGAKDDFYPGLSPSYHVKNGPIDSLDEMLLIQGVTSDLLWGSDLNFNGQTDPGEVGGSNNGAVDLGWAPYLTLYSRESNITNAGNPRIYINDSSLMTLQTNLNAVLGGPLTNFILAYRLYGGSPAPTTGTSGSSKAPQALSSGDQGLLQTKMTTDLGNPNTKPKGSISSLYSLINSQVSVQVGSGRTAKTITFPSPLANSGQRASLLPLLLDSCTTSQKASMTPRINVNNAGQTVLSMLPGLQASDVQAIVANQPTYTNGAPEATYNTPAWLMTNANISATKMQAIEPYITARGWVFKFQVLGYFGGGSGPVSRFEAVVDTSFNRPRILYMRDLTERGKVFDMTQISQYVQYQ